MHLNEGYLGFFLFFNDADVKPVHTENHTCDIVCSSHEPEVIIFVLWLQHKQRVAQRELGAPGFMYALRTLRHGKKWLTLTFNRIFC